MIEFTILDQAKASKEARDDLEYLIYLDILNMLKSKGYTGYSINLKDNNSTLAALFM